MSSSLSLETEQGQSPIIWNVAGFDQVINQPRVSLTLVKHALSGALGVTVSQALKLPADCERYATLPPIYPEWLGDRGFCENHGVRFPYVAGAMARGIASVDMVVAMGRAGMMGFFGSAGLSLELAEQSIGQIKSQLPERAAWGCNLIHTPDEPTLEASMVQCFLRNGVTRISASAFMSLTPALATYAYKGVHQDASGRIVRQNYIFAKISRPETAAAFLKPAPKAMLDKLVAEGLLTAQEAALAASLPVAEDITVESDSGGHTDNQILTALFPSILTLRDQCVAEFGYQRPIRVGAAGGLGTPSAVAAAFALGAAYVLTGSVNQSCIEAGVSAPVKALLAEVKTGDVAMAPCADMFEGGVKVQVLKRKSLYAVRASRLYEIYKQYSGLDDIPAEIKQQLESQIFRQSIEEIWQSTEAFFQQRNPAELAKAQQNPKHKMALVFRWYLGQSSRWPIVGDEDRVVDYQVWCGPAMAAFNDWVKGSVLEQVGNRSVVQVARNLLEGAVRVTRAQQLRSLGLPVPQSAFDYRPEFLN